MVRQKKRNRNWSLDFKTDLRSYVSQNCFCGSKEQQKRSNYSLVEIKPVILNLITVPWEMIQFHIVK